MSERPVAACPVSPRPVPQRPVTGHPGTSRRKALLLVLLVLLGLIVVGRLAMRAWLDRPAPLRLPEVGATTAEARPLCFVVIDGLREASAWAEEDAPMPWLQSFALRGAWGIAWAGDPTLTAPCVRALLTGRAPDLVTSFKNFDADPVPGNVIGYLRDRGAKTAHAGDATIYQFCRSHYDPAMVFAVPDQGPTDTETDGRAVAFMLERIHEGADVVTLHLTLPDHTGHMSGATGPEYHRACAIADRQVRTVVEAFLERHPQALVLIAADHGVSPTGTHGGGETTARRAPFVLVGPGVAQVGPVEISQYAVAPTIAGLLGLPVPPLADAPPAPELMDLPPEREVEVMDAYIQARIVVARSLGAETVDPIERKRAQVTVRRMVGEKGESYDDLVEELNRILNPSSWLHATIALLLTALWLVTAVHLASVDDVSRRGGRIANVYCLVASLPALAYTSLWQAALLMLVGCLIVLFVAAREKPRGTWFTLACLAVVPVVTAAGLSFSPDWPTPEAQREAALRGAIAAGILLVLGACLLRPRRLVRRLAERARQSPGLVGAFGGVALGFTLTLRPFVNPIVDLRILFACVGLGVVWYAVLSRAARARPLAERVALAVVGTVLFVAPRVADIRLETNWLEVVARRDTAWLVTGLLLVLVLLVAARARRLAREDVLGFVLALVALAGAYAVRLQETPTALISRGTNLVGIAALLVTLVRGSPDGKLVVRLLTTVALGRRLMALDGEFVPFVLFVVLAALAARFPAPKTRVGIAWLAVGLLAIRTAAHHAMGGVMSFSTVDVAAGFVGMKADPTLTTGVTGSVTWPIIEATAQLSLRFSLIWIVLLAAAGHALRDVGRLRELVGDLALTFAARFATIVAALWAWWRSAWWVEQARAVYALGAADVVLLLVAALLVGVFTRAPIPADVETRT